MHTFKIGSLLMAGTTLCGNEIMKIANYNIPFATSVSIAGGCIVCGVILDKLLEENKYQKLFRMCGLINKAEQLPVIIKKTKKDKETTLVLHLPAGLSQKHFEQKQEELEQYLNAKIEFGFNKNLILKLISKNLSSMYNYIFQGCEKPLEVYCGETYEGKFILDIEKCPHILMAGETNSGKTSALDNIVLSLILNPHNIDLHLIDFQAVGLGIFENCKKVKSYAETPEDFSKLLNEMEEENKKRLKLFRSVKNKVYIEKLSVWNEKFPDKALPYKVIVIDEFARLAEKEYEDILEKFRTRVSMDRKVGIHYIVSMQRPDVKCISGSIKANMPTRIAFKTVSQVDSEVILDQGGAEDIKEQGRFLIKYCGIIQEVQALFIEPDKVRGFIKKHNKLKSKQDIENEKKEQMKKLREKCINPYLKKDVNA